MKAAISAIPTRRWSAGSSLTLSGLAGSHALSIAVTGFSRASSVPLQTVLKKLWFVPSTSHWSFVNRRPCGEYLTRSNTCPPAEEEHVAVARRQQLGEVGAAIAERIRRGGVDPGDGDHAVQRIDRRALLVEGDVLRDALGAARVTHQRHAREVQPPGQPGADRVARIAGDARAGAVAPAPHQVEGRADHLGPRRDSRVRRLAVEGSDHVGAR